MNNVGASKHEHFECVKPRAFFDLMKVNVEPALQLTRALLPAMRHARFGRIINITSLVTRGLPFRTSYAAAKSALESLTRTMAIELARDGITANQSHLVQLKRSFFAPIVHREVKARNDFSLTFPWDVVHSRGDCRSDCLSRRRERRIHYRTDSICRS